MNAQQQKVIMYEKSFYARFGRWEKTFFFNFKTYNPQQN